FPWYALRENYCAAITKAGGVPLCLPHEVELAEHYLALLSGLVVTGGAFDVDPALFGATEKHATVVTKERRTRFEWAMLQGALTRNMPILGICGGEQLINVVKGGTLVQHIPDEIAGAEEHEIKPKSKPAHTVEVEEKTLLHSIAG